MNSNVRILFAFVAILTFSRCLPAHSQDTYVPEPGTVYREFAIPDESPQQAVANLWKDIVTREFLDCSSPSERIAMLESMPRVAVILNKARNGTPAQIVSIRTALTHYAKAYVSGIPSGNAPNSSLLGETSIQNAETSAAIAVPLLMVETGVDRREILTWIARMNRRLQRVLHGLEGVSAPPQEVRQEEWIITPQMEVFSAVADQILRSFLQDRSRSPSAFSPQEQAALERYQEILNVMAEVSARTATATGNPDLDQEAMAENEDRFSSIQAVNIMSIVEQFCGMRGSR